MSEEVPGNENDQSLPINGNRARSSSVLVSEVINQIDVTDSLTIPLKKAIDELLHLASEAVGSAVASVLVRDGDEGGLRFLTATSGVSDELLALRLPPGAGIAGLVFSTTQPMAVADVSNEGSFWSEADRRTGFKTITLLATPLRANGEMVGVLEFINRPGDPPYPPFTPAEMDTGSRFADAIASLIDEYEIARLVEAFVNHSIKATATTTSATIRESDLREWLEHSPATTEHRDLLMLWVSLREIITRGGAEREFCRDLLEIIARFTKQSGQGSNFGF
jgi:GAF domain-containing protein